MTPRTAAHQASLSFTVSWSLLKFMSTELVMPSNHLILCGPLFLLTSIFYLLSGSFPTSQLFTSGGQSIGASALASALPMYIHGWFPLGLTDLISCYPKGFSIVFSSITIWKYNFLALSLLYGPTLTSVHDYCTWLYRPLLEKWCFCFLIHCLGLS